MLRELETKLALRHNLVYAYITAQSGMESATSKLNNEQTINISKKFIQIFNAKIYL